MHIYLLAARAAIETGDSSRTRLFAALLRNIARFRSDRCVITATHSSAVENYTLSTIVARHTQTRVTDVTFVTRVTERTLAGVINAHTSVLTLTRATELDVTCRGGR